MPSRSVAAHDCATPGDAAITVRPFCCHSRVRPPPSPPPDFVSRPPHCCSCVTPADLINALAAAITVPASQISQVSYDACPSSDSAEHTLVLSLNGGDCSYVQRALGAIPAVNQTVRADRSSFGTLSCR